MNMKWKDTKLYQEEYREIFEELAKRDEFTLEDIECEFEQTLKEPPYELHDFIPLEKLVYYYARKALVDIED